MIQSTSPHPLSMVAVRVAGAVMVAITGCATVDFSPHVEGETARRIGHGARLRADGQTFSWPAGIRPGRALSAEEVVAVALWNNPDFQLALTDLHVSRAEVIRAGQLVNPSLSLLFPNNTEALELTARLPLEALWLRPQRVKAAVLDAEATAERLVQGGLDTARDVRIACAAVQLARERGLHARENARIVAEMAGVAASRLKAGETGELESSQAAAEARVATQEADRLAYEEKLALEKLRALLGMAAGGGTVDLKRLPAPRRRAPPSMKLLVAEALRSRPDVRAAELGVIAAGARMKLAAAELFAFAAGAKFTEGAGTQAGFGADVPLVHQNQAGRSAARARFSVALRQLHAASERTAAEVRQARTRLDEALTVSRGWDAVLPDLENALTKARRSVEMGETPQLVALDAARRLSEARGRGAESEARLREAWAELERASGHRL